jgi:hypothetical protein
VPCWWGETPALEDNVDLSKLTKPKNRWRSTVWIIVDTPAGFKDVLAEERTVVGHIDDNNQFWLLAFEDIDHAGTVVKEYESCKKHEAHIVSFNVYTMPAEWHIRLYRMDGSWLDLEQWAYLQRLHLQDA